MTFLNLLLLGPIAPIVVLLLLFLLLLLLLLPLLLLLRVQPLSFSPEMSMMPFLY